MVAKRISSALQLAQVAADNWELVQVELQGKYSPERLRAFYTYTVQTHWCSILLWCIVTPIPCLVINILLDIAPLAPPSAGRDANYVFFARLGIFAVIVNYYMLIQIGYLTPALGMKPWHALSTAIIVGIACAINAYELAGLVAMPVPFILIIATPAYLTPTIIMFIIYFGRRIKNDPALRASLNRASTIIHLQIFLTFIYPTFIYGFNSIPSKYQTPFMILIPVTKIIAKNIMSRLIGNNHDLKPVELIFNIDCFNAIYVSLAMGSTTTISTSLVVMLIDAIQGCVSVYDVYTRFQPLKRFMNSLPVSHPLRGKNFLEVAIALDQESDFVHRDRQTLFSIPCGPAVDTKSVKPSHAKTGRRASAKVFVAPRKSTNREAAWNTDPNLCSPKRRVVFLDATKKLLFTTEFVILVEYTEVIMPVFYGLLMTATYYLPNRAFYATIAGIDEHELWSMVASVLMYAALELVSLVVMELVLRHITGVSAIRQVGFVLDNQGLIAQSKMLSWVLYAVQNSLEHFGADYSFQFKWMRSH